MAVVSNFTIYLPDATFLERVRAAAGEQGISPGEFFRRAAEKSLLRHERKRGSKGAPRRTRAA